ncbi:uncharacterized protein [Miscanthus floridulus]|uniref:uncharacterized protein n=1 Tax=Miscanthus floridulus TaxID=154761 RepID=UPI00345B3CFA
MNAVCEVCGAIGFERLLLCCSDCKGAHTHQYCLKEVVLDASLEDWFCDECNQRHNESSHSSSLGKVSSERPSNHAQFDSISQQPFTRSWSGSRHSSSIKAATKMSMSHPTAGIPAANEGGVRSSLARDSYIGDFFDPIASEPQSEPAHERWDPMRSEGLVVLEKSPGVGASVSADWFDDTSCKPCSPPGPSLGLLGSLLGSDQGLFDGGGLCRPRRWPSPSVQRSSNSPGGRSSSCLGLDEMDGSSKTVVLVVSQGVAPGTDSDSAGPRMDSQDVRASSEVVLPGSPSALTREFARRVTAPLQTPVLKAPPRRRSCRSPPSASLHRSGRLAAKSHLRAANATLQAQKVLLWKWDPATPKQHLAPQALNAFHRSRLTRPRGKHCGCCSKWT